MWTDVPALQCGQKTRHHQIVADIAGPIKMVTEMDVHEERSEVRISERQQDPDVALATDVNRRT